MHTFLNGGGLNPPTPTSPSGYATGQGVYVILLLSRYVPLTKNIIDRPLFTTGHTIHFLFGSRVGFHGLVGGFRIGGSNGATSG